MLSVLTGCFNWGFGGFFVLCVVVFFFDEVPAPPRVGARPACTGALLLAGCQLVAGQV